MVRLKLEGLQRWSVTTEGLIVLDNKKGQLVSTPRTFDDATEALAAHSAMEFKHQADKDLETVLIGSGSLETVKQTHGNYFEAQMAKVHHCDFWDEVTPAPPLNDTETPRASSPPF
jgi:hypothetical protein